MDSNRAVTSSRTSTWQQRQEMTPSILVVQDSRHTILLGVLVLLVHCFKCAVGYRGRLASRCLGGAELVTQRLGRTHVFCQDLLETRTRTWVFLPGVNCSCSSLHGCGAGFHGNNILTYPPPRSSATSSGIFVPKEGSGTSMPIVKESLEERWAKSRRVVELSGG